MRQYAVPGGVKVLVSAGDVDRARRIFEAFSGPHDINDEPRSVKRDKPRLKQGLFQAVFDCHYKVC